MFLLLPVALQPFVGGLLYTKLPFSWLFSCPWSSSLPPHNPSNASWVFHCIFLAQGSSNCNSFDCSSTVNSYSMSCPPEFLWFAEPANHKTAFEPRLSDYGSFWYKIFHPLLFLIRRSERKVLSKTKYFSLEICQLDLSFLRHNPRSHAYFYVNVITSRIIDL